MEIFGDKGTSNRTSMELKLHHCNPHRQTGCPSNRTSMELKHDRLNLR